MPEENGRWYRKRITGGNITDLIDRSNVNFLGHVGIRENYPTTNYSFWGELGELIKGGIDVREELYSAKKVDRRSTTLYLLSKALNKKDLFLARTNLVYAENFDSQDELMLIGFGDLYQRIQQK